VFLEVFTKTNLIAPKKQIDWSHLMKKETIICINQKDLYLFLVVAEFESRTLHILCIVLVN